MVQSRGLENNEEDLSVRDLEAFDDLEAREGKLKAVVSVYFIYL